MCGVCNYNDVCRMTDGKATIKVCASHLVLFTWKGWRVVTHKGEDGFD